MLLKCAVVLYYFAYSWSMEIGDTCEVESNVGTCKPISECPFALKQIREFKRSPKTCFFMGWTSIVCCPSDSIPGEPIGLLEIDSGATLDVPPSREPAGCPPLDPVPTKLTDIAFQKCLEYRRYVLPCVVKLPYFNTFYRENRCGIIERFNRIWDGTPAERKEFPHMALLGYRNELTTNLDPLKWVAVGTLISDKYILTAAHVVVHHDYGPLCSALLGVINITEAQDGLLYNIINIIVHKSYERTQIANDIALLKLDRRVQLSEFIRPACLPSPGLEVMDTTRITAGWRRTENDPFSDVLIKEYVAEFDHETECKKGWPDFINSACKRDSVMFAGRVSRRVENTDSRTAESGGPLMALARDVDCTYIVRGVLSFGSGSGPSGIYTDVRAYLPWIIENVWRK